jgi:hypothetical protein
MILSGCTKGGTIGFACRAGRNLLICCQRVASRGKTKSGAFSITDNRSRPASLITAPSKHRYAVVAPRVVLCLLHLDFGLNEFQSSAAAKRPCPVKSRLEESNASPRNYSI